MFTFLQERFRLELVPKTGAQVYVPLVHHEYTTRKVLVSEWIEGIKLAASPKDTINRLVPIGLNCFLIQVLLQTGPQNPICSPNNLT